MAIEIKFFRKYEKNTLKGFLTVLLQPSGIEIRDLTLHEKNGKRWVNMPNKPYEDEGETKYSYIVFFPDKDRAQKFQEATLKALDKYRPPEPDPEPIEDDDLPF